MKISISATNPCHLYPQARALAAQAYRNQQLGKLGEQRLNETKAKAKIEYQPGYEPPAAKKG